MSKTAVMIKDLFCETLIRFTPASSRRSRRLLSTTILRAARDNSHTKIARVSSRRPSMASRAGRRTVLLWAETSRSSNHSTMRKPIVAAVDSMVARCLSGEIDVPVGSLETRR
ncbi:MAG TPA: hypothetical protein VNE62_06105 [Actinomycetota bacterium]|nr:hypothetical protein [Actinomycetota bacterium]